MEILQTKTKKRKSSLSWFCEWSTNPWDSLKGFCLWHILLLTCPDSKRLSKTGWDLWRGWNLDCNQDQISSSYLSSAALSTQTQTWRKAEATPGARSTLALNKMELAWFCCSVTKEVIGSITGHRQGQEDVVAPLLSCRGPTRVFWFIQNWTLYSVLIQTENIQNPALCLVLIRTENSPVLVC